MLWEYGRGGRRRLWFCEAVVDVALGGCTLSSSLTQKPVAQILSLMSSWTQAYFLLLVQHSYLNLMIMGSFS